MASTFKWIDRKGAIEKAGQVVLGLGVPVEGAAIGVIRNSQYAVNLEKMAPNQARNFKSAVEKYVKERRSPH